MNYNTILSLDYINKNNKYYNYYIVENELHIENKITKEITKLPFKKLENVEYYLYGIYDFIYNTNNID